MPYYKVLARYRNRCGGESFSFIIRADDETKAREKAQADVASLEYNYYGADRYKYTVEEISEEDEVVMIEHDEWG